MNEEIAPATIVRELVATEIHRRRLIALLEQATMKEVLDPNVFRYSHLITGGDTGQGFGEGFSLSNEDVELLLHAAFVRNP